ncbi:MAG: T3SS effector HopA1 family protein [Acidobacteriota bacterium]|nr:T3SS effector HopA1 family protein [Acidobacteriota bacterium]
MTARTARNYLLNQLQNQLYTEFYIRGKASSRLWNDEIEMTRGTDFVDTLSAANAGSGCRESGWEVVEATADEVAIRRNRLTLWVTRADLEAPGSQAISCGADLKLRMPKELRSISPGYYLALGDRAEPDGDTARLVRMYWNLRRESAETFLREATLALNRGGFFFRLKLLNDPGSYARCDAAVLYIRQCDYAAISSALGPVYASVAHRLKPRTPAFTKTLAPGLGVAEDPGQIESFGQHRCRLLAEGLIRGYEQNAKTLDERFRMVSDYFKAEGIDVDRPYLGPDSSDLYTFAV